MKVWNLTNCRLKTNHIGHNGYLNCVTVSPDGSLCASGGKVRMRFITLFEVNSKLKVAPYSCLSMGLVTK